MLVFKSVSTAQCMHRTMCSKAALSSNGGGGSQTLGELAESSEARFNPTKDCPAVCNTINNEAAKYRQPKRPSAILLFSFFVLHVFVLE
jgi:hypothetical protein